MGNPLTIMLHPIQRDDQGFLMTAARMPLKTRPVLDGSDVCEIHTHGDEQTCQNHHPQQWPNANYGEPFCECGAGIVKGP